MDHKTLLIESGKRMLRSGLTVETWGNISVRDPETGLVYLTPSGMPYDSITEDDVVVMTLDGARVEGARKPTIEWGMHLGILKQRPDVNAVLHTHPLYSQVFGLLGEEIPPCIDEAAQVFGGPVRVSEYALPGSEALAKNVAAALGDGAACLMARHGAVCVGADMDAAFKVCTVLEMTAQIYYMARCIGTPEALPPDKVAFLHDFVTKHYGQDK